MFNILFATTIFALSLGQAPKFEKCNSTMGHVVGITLSGAEVEDGKYILKKGTNITADGDFIPNQDVKQAICVGQGIFGSIGVPFQMSHPDVCEVLKCPLQKNVQYNLKEWATVQSVIFTVDIILQLEVIDKDSNATIACAQFPARMISE